MKQLFSNVRGDFFGGLTAGIVALPLALAFGVSSGMGPSAGLYGAIFIAFFAALFGGTATQISGPTAPMTAISTIVVAGLIASFDGDLSKATPTILVVFFIAGVIQILMGAAKLGSFIKYIPYPVVSGFMTAIGIMIIITQIFPLVGYYPKEDAEFVSTFKPKAEEVLLEKILKDEAGEGLLVLEDFEETIKRSHEVNEDAIWLEAQTLAAANASGVVGTIRNLPRALQNINWLSVALGLTTIVVIYGFKKVTTAVPSTLVALLLITVLPLALQIDYRPISQIPSGFPKFRLDMFSNFGLSLILPFLGSSIMLAFLGSIDSLLTSVVADNMTKTRHKSNQELIGQGIGNSIASMFGGIPGAGATIRTVVNINAGGKTKLSGMIAGIVLLVILLLLGPYASKIPAAVLAGILITVGIGVMDYKGLKAIPVMPRSEVIIMLTVMILSVFWNLIYAVGIGLIMASLSFVKQIGDMAAKNSKVTSLDTEEKPWMDEKGEIPVKLKEEVYVKHLAGPLFFGSTQEIQKLVSKIPSTATHVILRMDNVSYIDQTGLYTLEDLILQFESNNIETLLVDLQEQPRALMENIDIIPDLVSENHIFPDFHTCAEFVTKEVRDVV